MIFSSQQRLQRHAVGTALSAAALDVLACATQATLAERARHGVARAGARLEHQRHRLFHAAQGLDPPLVEGAGTELCTHFGSEKQKPRLWWLRGFA